MLFCDRFKFNSPCVKNVVADQVSLISQQAEDILQSGQVGLLNGGPFAGQSTGQLSAERQGAVLPLLGARFDARVHQHKQLRLHRVSRGRLRSLHAHIHQTHTQACTIATHTEYMYTVQGQIFVIINFRNAGSLPRAKNICNRYFRNLHVSQ